MSKPNRGPPASSSSSAAFKAGAAAAVASRAAGGAVATAAAAGGGGGAAALPVVHYGGMSFQMADVLPPEFQHAIRQFESTCATNPAEANKNFASTLSKLSGGTMKVEEVERIIQSLASPGVVIPMIVQTGAPSAAASTASSLATSSSSAFRPPSASTSASASAAATAPGAATTAAAAATPAASMEKLMKSFMLASVPNTRSVLFDPIPDPYHSPALAAAASAASTLGKAANGGAAAKPAAAAAAASTPAATQTPAAKASTAAASASAPASAAKPSTASASSASSASSAPAAAPAPSLPGLCQHLSLMPQYEHWQVEELRWADMQDGLDVGCEEALKLRARLTQQELLKAEQKAAAAAAAEAAEKKSTTKPSTSSSASASSSSVAASSASAAVAAIAAGSHPSSSKASVAPAAVVRRCTGISAMSRLEAAFAQTAPPPGYESVRAALHAALQRKVFAKFKAKPAEATEKKQDATGSSGENNDGDAAAAAAAAAASIPSSSVVGRPRHRLRWTDCNLLFSFGTIERHFDRCQRVDPSKSFAQQMSHWDTVKPLADKQAFITLFRTILKSATKELQRKEWLAQIGAITQIRRVLDVHPPPLEVAYAVEGLVKRLITLLCVEDEMLMLREIMWALMQLSRSGKKEDQALLIELRAPAVVVRCMARGPQTIAAAAAAAAAATPAAGGDAAKSASGTCMSSAAAAAAAHQQLLVSYISFLASLAAYSASSRDAVLHAGALPIVLALECEKDSLLCLTVSVFLRNILRQKPSLPLETLVSASSSSSSSSPPRSVLHALARNLLYASSSMWTDSAAVETMCQAWAAFFDNYERSASAPSPTPNAKSKTATTNDVAKANRRARVQAFRNMHRPGGDSPPVPLVLSVFAHLCTHSSDAVARSALLCLWHVTACATTAGERAELLDAGILPALLPWIGQSALVDELRMALCILRVFSWDPVCCERMAAAAVQCTLSSVLEREAGSLGDPVAFNEATYVLCNMMNMGGTAVKCALMHDAPNLLGALLRAAAPVADPIHSGMSAADAANVDVGYDIERMSATLPTMALSALGSLLFFVPNEPIDSHFGGKWSAVINPDLAASNPRPCAAVMDQVARICVAFKVGPQMPKAPTVATDGDATAAVAAMVADTTGAKARASIAAFAQKIFMRLTQGMTAVTQTQNGDAAGGATKKAATKQQKKK